MLPLKYNKTIVTLSNAEKLTPEERNTIRELSDNFVKQITNNYPAGKDEHFFSDEQIRGLIQADIENGISAELIKECLAEHKTDAMNIYHAHDKAFFKFIRPARPKAKAKPKPAKSEPQQENTADELQNEPVTESAPAEESEPKQIPEDEIQPEQDTAEPEPVTADADQHNTQTDGTTAEESGKESTAYTDEERAGIFQNIGLYLPDADRNQFMIMCYHCGNDKATVNKWLRDHKCIRFIPGNKQKIIVEGQLQKIYTLLDYYKNVNDERLYAEVETLQYRIDLSTIELEDLIQEYIKKAQNTNTATEKPDAEPSEPEAVMETPGIELDVIDSDGTIIKADGEKLDANSDEADRIKEEYTKERKAETESRKDNHEYYDNYATQLGLRNFIIDHLKPHLLYDKDSGTWYVRDKYGCFPPSKTNGYGEIADMIEKQITLLRSVDDEGKLYGKARKFCNKTNISQAIDLASPFLEGRPEDIAYVFDEGKTLHVVQDENGKYAIELKENPYGLKTQYRVEGEYWEGALNECPNDFIEWINGYGNREFIKALIRIMSRSLTCRPDKICFQFTSESGNTGKSTLTDGFMGAWGKYCYTRIEAKEIMTKNQTGRRTALLQAIQKPFTVLNEAEGRIDEGTFKEAVDTSKTFSGNWCGRDRVEVPRHSQLFIESNNLIRATNTSAYQNRAYPIEFIHTFPMDDRIQAKIRGKWMKYARGIMIHELREYIDEFNKGNGIEKQLIDICPELAENRARLTQAQDYRQSVINTICQNTGDPNDTESWDYLYGRVRDYIVGMGKEIPEWGMTKNQKYRDHEGRWEVSIQAKKSFNKTLKDMKYDVYRKQEGTQKYTWISKIRINES